MNYHGAIIEESLQDKSVLSLVRILETKVEPVTEKHHTPWLKQWTLHVVEVPEDRADEIAEKISEALDPERGGSWYADFKNDLVHYVIFLHRVFRIDRKDTGGYQSAVSYGRALGIPEHQLDFSPEIKQWERPMNAPDAQ